MRNTFRQFKYRVKELYDNTLQDFQIERESRRARKQMDKITELAEGRTVIMNADLKLSEGIRSVNQPIYIGNTSMVVETDAQALRRIAARLEKQQFGLWFDKPEGAVNLTYPKSHGPLPDENQSSYSSEYWDARKMS